MMLQKTKTALRITSDAYNEEILDLILAAIRDLQLIGSSFVYAVSVTEGETVDYQIDDPIIRQAVITYVKTNFGSPEEYDRLKKSYDEQKAQILLSRKYRKIREDVNNGPF